MDAVIQMLQGDSTLSEGEEVYLSRPLIKGGEGTASHPLGPVRVS